MSMLSDVERYNAAREYEAEKEAALRKSKVDHVIDRKCADFDDDDFVALAMVALDQAGVSRANQKRIEAIVRDALFEDNK